VKNIPAGTQLSLSASDFLANPSQVKTQADFDAAFTASAPYGGAFADLMIPYLNKKDAKAYDIVNGDSVAGRAALPPMLIGQGEKTQSAWLRDFLLNPGEVRRMTILRMPKFNMSADEAQALVDYFAGVTRQTNPGIGLSYPFETIASRQDFSSDYWTNRTAAYVAHLKNTKAKDKDGNELKTTVFAARLASYRPLWKRVQQDNQPALENERKKIESLIEQTTATTAAKEKAMQSAKDKDKEALKKEVDELKLSLASFADERDRVSKAIADLDVTAQERAWIDRDAYATDAYRMLMSRDLCTKCHQIGGIKAGEQTKQGPPLDQVADRLRPEWIVGWVAKPQRFVPASLMTQYFKHDKLEHQALYADTSLAQIHALRDVLLNYRRVAAMPVNRNHNPDRPVEK
jgi:cbb3-type cytochrome oxidase cytochrome c subunit